MPQTPFEMVRQVVGHAGFVIASSVLAGLVAMILTSLLLLRTTRLAGRSLALASQGVGTAVVVGLLLARL